MCLKKCVTTCDVLSILLLFLYTGLPAAESGLKTNDIIIEVEGIDVTKASGQVVVEMIR